MSCTTSKLNMHAKQKVKMDSGFYPIKPLQHHELQAIRYYSAVESQSMAAAIFEKERFRTLRDHVVHLIQKHSKSANEKFDAYIPYIALNYFERFISRNPLPIIEDKDLDYRALLLSICCLSIASKMRTKCFDLGYFLSQGGVFVFNRRHILETELVILKGLEWKLNSPTALSFVRYFVFLVSSPSLSTRRVCKFIIRTYGDINMTQFKPSVVAAAAILAAGNFRNKRENKSFMGKLTGGEIVQLDAKEVTDCMQYMIGVCVRKEIINVSSEMADDGESSDGSDGGETTIGGDDSAKDELKLDFKLKWVADEFINESSLMKLDPAIFLRGYEPKNRRKTKRNRFWQKLSLMQWKLL